MKTFIALFLIAIGVSTNLLADSHASLPDDPNEIAATALANGDPESGERVFRKCRACHEVGVGAESKTGPPLNNIVGSQMAQFEGFNYSKSLDEMGADGMIWSVENLDAFLANPRDFAERSKMTFAGLRREQERKDIIAYLASISEE